MSLITYYIYILNKHNKENKMSYDKEFTQLKHYKDVYEKKVYNFKMYETVMKQFDDIAENNGLTRSKLIEAIVMRTVLNGGKNVSNINNNVIDIFEDEPVI